MFTLYWTLLANLRPVITQDIVSRQKEKPKAFGGHKDFAKIITFRNRGFMPAHRIFGSNRNINS